MMKPAQPCVKSIVILETIHTMDTTRIDLIDLISGSTERRRRGDSAQGRCGLHGAV
jgi:hypothetical protein